MKGWANRPLRTLINANQKSKPPLKEARVWNLNLDQIESHSGRVLSKIYVNATELGPSTYAFEPRTVLYSKLRPYLNKVVVADEAGVATTELVPIKCNSDEVHPEFLAYFLRSSDFLKFATTVVAGAKMPRMVMSEFWDFKVPLPPLPEQRRIAAILDQADALRAKRREALAQLDSLTQSIFVEMFGDPTIATTKFPQFPLENLVLDSFQNGAYYPKESYCEKEGVEMVHMSDAFQGVIARGNLKRVMCSDSDIEKYCLNSDDIIIARRSLTYEGAAKPCMVPKSEEALIFESSFIRVRPDQSRITPIYLYHYLNNERIRRKYVRPFITQSTISGINQSNLAQISVMQPPLEKQQEFCTAVAAIEHIRASFCESQIDFDSLFASLQHRAFRGEL